MSEVVSENGTSTGHRFLPYGHQWINGEDVNAVIRVLKNDWITQGS